MAGKLQPKSEMEEQLMEGASFLDNFATEIGKIITSLDENETLDHDNDKIRLDINALLLDALHACHVRNVDDAQKFTHAALQKLNQQQAIDFKDDLPRVDVRIKLTQLQTKAICDYEAIIKLIPKLKLSKVKK